LLAVSAAVGLALAVGHAAQPQAGDMNLARLHQRIDEKAGNHNEAAVLIVAFGDSVTQGFTQVGHLEPTAVYHARLKTMLEEAYPRTTFSVLNAGHGGVTAAAGSAMLERDVIRHQPDLVIIGFGLNDCQAGAAGAAAYEKTLTEQVLAVRAQTQAQVILLTPNFMCTGSNGAVPRNLTHLVAQFQELQNQGVLAAYADAVRRVGAAQSAPVADVYAAWRQLQSAGVDTNKLLANGLNHPIAEAQRIPAELVMQIIKPEYRPRVVADLSRQFAH
jgi:lysophospholipase L1-like esterase